MTKYIGFRPRVMSCLDTIQCVCDKRMSLCRFGDGELRWMYGLKQNSFQKQDEDMRIRLIEVIDSKDENLLISIPDVFGDLSKYKNKSKDFWMTHMGKFKFLWLKLLRKKQVYGNANVTRFYMDYKDKTGCQDVINAFEELWKGRDVIIVEGSQTRFGYGNDLLQAAKRIRRVICPNKDAFDVYDNILGYVQDNIDKDCLILIALGPTATILAYDLARDGYQAIDVGHLDVEYEWYKMSAKEKMPLQNKYVNEVSETNPMVIEVVEESEYVGQILVKIERKEGLVC